LSSVPGMNPEALIAILGRCAGVSVTVIGDLMLDEYIEGSVERISPEAPVPIVRAQRSELRLGGAANVARQIRALGAKVALVGVVGDDAMGLTLKHMCAEAGIETGGILTIKGRPTTRKLRVLGPSQQLLRIDWEDQRPLSEPHSQALLASLESLSIPDALMLSDYAKGVLTDTILSTLAGEMRGPRCPRVVDPKRREFANYRGARVITPNLRELSEAAGRPLDPENMTGIIAAAREQIHQGRFEAVLVTLGERGMLVASADGSETRVPALRRPIYDVTGAGDTVAGVVTACLAAGATIIEAAYIANHAAGIAVGEIGAVAVPSERIAAALSVRPAGKLRTRGELEILVQTWRASGKRVVFTNGCFDLLHPGHLSLLHFAKSLGDVLVLAINSDLTVRRLKGPDRPVVSQGDRAALLGALECVDAVTMFDEDTPLESVRSVMPDVLVKGQDYRMHEIIGRELVEAAGGCVVLAPLVPDYSTTKLLQRVRA
jgi:D-beta-D-heptose 7-phosphate kinase/D-beta-D-heptose 1-phosphate adenosyltransferase